MTITKETLLTRIELDYRNVESGKPRITASYVTTIDDPDDDELPVSMNKSITYHAVVNGEATDLTGQDQRIQDIAAVVWA